MVQEDMIDFNNISIEDGKKWLDSFDTVLSDCDGVLWVGTSVLKDSNTVVNRLQELGKRVYFITNNASKSPTEYAEMACNRDFNINANNILTPALSMIDHLKKIQFNKKAYIIGSSLVNQIASSNIRVTENDSEQIHTHYTHIAANGLKLENDVGAVLVHYEPNFEYSHILKAANYLRDPNCIFLTTSMDNKIPSGNEFIIPGISPIVHSIETCTQRKVTLMCKPNPIICKSLLNDGITMPERTLMIGDNADTDILLGKNCEFKTLLVGSGLHTKEDIQRWQMSEDHEEKRLIPHAYAEKLGDLLKFLI